MPTVTPPPDGRPRCDWAMHDTLEQHYHDTEWGIPQHDDRMLFELLTLEGAQAGLSWRTVLHKRENYRKAFDQFDLAKIARYTPVRVEKLLQNPGIIRHRGKIEATIANARLALALIKSHGSLDAWLWSFVDGKPIINHPKRMADIPASTAVSDAMSRALKKQGFKFVGSTICYAFMQATGMTNDHLTTCAFRHHP